MRTTEPLRPQPTRRIGIEDEVAFLSSRDAWWERPRRVEVVETHLSWVFLTQRHAYKLKKPLAFDVVDLRSLDARFENAWTETELNRRLAPRIYLGVLPLVLRPDDRLAVGGNGEAVDWILAMRRLPADRMMDEAIARGTASREQVQPVARRLARFYADIAPPCPVTAGVYRTHLIRRIGENRAAFLLPGSPIHATRVHAEMNHQMAFVESGRLDDRSGRLCEGHGDLRPEHVCIDPPVIIDCLEFDRVLRLRDPADELAQLLLGCELARAPELGHVFVDAYRDATDDHPRPEVLAFYRRYVACVRGRLAMWRTGGGSASNREHLRMRAHQSFEMAAGVPPRV